MAHFFAAPFLFLAHVNMWIVALITGNRYQMLEGMTLYVDDDGQVKLIFQDEDDNYDE